MEKVLGSPLELSATILFTFDKYPLKIWVENSVSAIQHIGNRKRLWGASPPPPDQAYPFAYSCSFTLHTSYKNVMLDQRGEGCQNAQRQIIIKAH